MKKNVKPIPEGYHTATTYLTVNGAAKALDFYKRAFGAKELFRMPGPDGKVAHAEILIGNSHIMLADECGTGGEYSRSPGSLKGSTSGIFRYVGDVDSAIAEPLKAGANESGPLQNMFLGYRFRRLVDPCGHPC